MHDKQQQQVTIMIKVDGERAQMIKKLFEEIDATRAEKLANVLGSDFDKKFEERTRRIDLMEEAAAERLRQILELEGQIGSQLQVKDKPWTTGRYIWAAVSVVLGGAVAWIFQMKLPALNHAACGVTGGLAFEKLGLRGQRSFLGSAIGGLSGTWLKQNFELGEIALASPAYAYTLFTTGEDFREGYMEWKARREAEKKEAKAEQGSK